MNSKITFSFLPGFFLQRSVLTFQNDAEGLMSRS